MAMLAQGLSSRWGGGGGGGSQYWLAVMSSGCRPTATGFAAVHQAAGTGDVARVVPLSAMVCVRVPMYAQIRVRAPWRDQAIALLRIVHAHFGRVVVVSWGG